MTIKFRDVMAAYLEHALGRQLPPGGICAGSVLNELRNTTKYLPTAMYWVHRENGQLVISMMDPPDE